MRFGSALAVLFLRSAGLGALFLARHSGAFTCLDESGAFVDFFAALKVNNDLNYYYTDPDVTELTRSVYKIENASGGSIVDTVNQFYGDLGSSYAYAMYNDQVS
jgi:hypothetical protein